MCEISKASSNIPVNTNLSQSSSIAESNKPGTGSFDGRSLQPTEAPKFGQLPNEQSSISSKSLTTDVKVTNPPFSLSELAKSFTLSDRETLTSEWGKPKDDILFGLIKMSTNYKSVLNHLDKVHDAMDNMKAWNSDSLPEQMISKFKNELTGLEKAVDQYIAGSNNQRFKTEMAFFKLDIQREKTILKEFVENQSTRTIGYGVTLNEAINYAKQGIDPSQFKLFKEVVLHPQDNNSPINYLSNDQKNMLTEPATKDTVSGLIEKAGYALKELQTNVESYKQHEGLSKGFKTLGNTIIQQQDLHKNIDKFKEAINQQETILKELATQAKDWPQGMSLKEAISYANYSKEGFSLAEAKILKEHSINPKELQKIVNNENKDIKSIINQLSPDKIAASICADAQKLRVDLRKQDQLSDENVAKLVSQADYAVKQYVDIFEKSGKIPVDLQKMSHKQLENNINKLPQADLSKENRKLATKLMGLINENTSLIHLKYQGFDKDFTAPKDLVKDVYSGKISSTNLEENQENAQSFVGNQLKNIGKKLNSIIESKKLDDSKDIEGKIKDYFIGFVKDRIDIQVCFGIINQNQTEQTLSQCLGEIKSLTDQQKDNLCRDLLGKANEFIPKQHEITDLKEIGSGGQGVAFSGKYKDEKIIMKATAGVFNPSDEGWKGTIKESLIMAQFKENPYIPKIIGSNLNENMKKIIMERIGNSDYEKLNVTLKNKEPPAKIMASVHCITGIVKGLEFMHSQDLVHCDLKLPNMVLDPKTLEPRLIDFGVCEKRGFNDIKVGTNATMSPEALYEKGVQPASDIYALGCIMYQQITSTATRNIESTQVLSKLSKPMWDGSLELGYCRRFIESCIQEDPDRRPTTEQILQAVRSEEITPALEGKPGLREEELGCLDILKPENGYAMQGKEILAEIYKKKT